MTAVADLSVEMWDDVGRTFNCTEAEALVRLEDEEDAHWHPVLTPALREEYF